MHGTHARPREPGQPAQMERLAAAEEEQGQQLPPDLPQQQLGDRIRQKPCSRHENNRTHVENTP